MKKILLLIVMLLSISMFSQIGTHNFTQSLNTKIGGFFVNNKSTLVVLDKLNYGDVKLIITKLTPSRREEFTNVATGTRLLYYSLVID